MGGKFLSNIFSSNSVDEKIRRKGCVDVNRVKQIVRLRIFCLVIKSLLTLFNYQKNIFPDNEFFSLSAG